MLRIIRLLASLVLLFLAPLSAYELSIAAIFQNEAPYLLEWIEYHRMVGVEHFWLYNDQSRDEWQKILEPYLQAGIVEVIDWPVEDPFLFIQRQVEAYRDAVTRACERTQWLALIDIDEFLLPMQDSTITECLSKRFPTASGISVSWRQFGTGGVSLPDGTPILFHLKAASERNHPRNYISKSIVYPRAVNTKETWSPHFCVLYSQAQYFDGDGQPLRLEGPHLQLDRETHDRYIRLNHYTYRDENFFYRVRLPRAKKWTIDEDEVWKHYFDFNFSEDTAIMDFIREKHPQKFEELWKGK